MRFSAVVPILRFFDLEATKRFYVDYLGFTLDWVDGEPGGPQYMQVSREGIRLHLSSHHDDGTPGTAVLVETTGVRELHRELHATKYPFMFPGLEHAPADGLEVQVIDPASNRVRFWERGAATSDD